MLTAVDTKSSKVRDRIMHTAYRLFSSRGVSQVGIDTILAESGAAKASLYKHFKSKEDLVLAFLEMREDLWTRGWLEAGVREATDDPDGRLLAVFDVFDTWFRRRDFEGCAFVNVLLESEVNSPVHRAAARHLATIRHFLRGLAQDAGLERPKEFAEVWHFLMKGSIVSAFEGERLSAVRARGAGESILENWPRVAKRAGAA
ncbi:TetR/AcrR family transcriptional regulator [Ruegeria sp. 2012CJ41-6]|uniref:TetR/AcrR family transcriptional regulator n=1 Tax=Ruegeria spongiae TaxID=2942209 RepID=A0ABT0Q7X0_9RHOB|nr:TetR/AcrR family transcriptional regulator [Ruegeria spongiae]MCL6285961.1 TetR/AcrR family transcriptional regulator [Ruegeria spongiae]